MKMIASLLGVAALLAGLAGLPEASQTSCHGNCATSRAGIERIKHFEGYSPFVYKDAVGLDTIGHGHLVTGPVEEPLLPPAADALLRSDLKRFERDINRMVKVPLRTGQFDALASFTFNLGSGKLKQSTLLKKVNAGQHAAVPAQFMRWVYAGGKMLRGLKARREAEAAMYANGYR